MKLQNGLLKGLGVAAAAAAFALLSLGADAQDGKKPAAKAPSECKGLDQAACKAKSARCTWIAAVKLKSGTTRRAHCRARPTRKK
jgi:hypothetical protein